MTGGGPQADGAADLSCVGPPIEDPGLREQRPLHDVLEFANAAGSGGGD